MSSTPIMRGVARALLAAVLFGVTAPLLQRESAGTGALASGSLLYFGAAIVSLLGLALRPSRHAEPRLGRRGLRRLVLLALLGGAMAPALLVLGLRRVDAATGALLLAFEAPATVLLALLLHHEHFGRRVAVATSLIVAGGLVLAGRPQWMALSGGLLVVAAAVAWAMDNVLSRPLADRDPVLVVAGKSILGASASALLALLLRETWPIGRHALALLAIGGLGYGLSLQLYLRAQRAIGTARTASVFAAAPFIGAGAALLLGTPWPGGAFVAAAGLIGIGLWLHASEHHGHWHSHPGVEHEHTHTHDDGHHDHVHDPVPAGPHSHVHRHVAVAHEHEHGEDLHHRHSH